MAQLPKNIDVSKLRYSEMRSLASGAKTVYVNYGSEKLTIQTPVLSLPYGLSEPLLDAKEGGKNTLAEKEKKYDLTVNFRGLDENPKVKLFHDKLKEIEAKIIEDAYINRTAWLKDPDADKTFVSKLFSPIVKVDKDKETGKVLGKYPPTFKAKVPYDNKTDTFNFDCFDMDNNELDFHEIMNKLKGARAQLIVQLTGIWFAGGKYGCSWKIVSGKFQLHQNSKITFIEDSDNDNVVDDDEDDDVVDSEVLKNLPPTPVDDEDEEDEEEEEVDEEDEEDEDEASEPAPPAPAVVPQAKKSSKAHVVVETPPPVKKPVKKAAK